MWLAPTLFRLAAACDVKIWLQIAVRIRCAWMNRTEHNVWPTSTRFKANAPHSSAMNKAEALAERESRQAMNWNSIEGTRQTAYRHDGIAAPKKVPNDEANDFEPFQFWRIAYSLGHLCGSVFSRSLISSTSNSETHSLARNRPNQRPNGPFRSAVSCQRKINDVFCVSFHFRVRTRDIVARTRLRNAIIPLRCVRPKWWFIGSINAKVETIRRSKLATGKPNGTTSSLLWICSAKENPFAGLQWRRREINKTVKMEKKSMAHWSRGANSLFGNEWSILATLGVDSKYFGVSLTQTTIITFARSHHFGYNYYKCLQLVA